ncbi:MAG: hypothetical protein KBS82_02560 [Oscillospiraceae bacterium]|nr:hypothetical protein [Candidatus Limimonas egerieequi]
MATRFEEKRDRLKTAMNKGTPDRVPVFPIMDQYAVLVNDINLIDAYTKNPFLPALAVKKMYERGVYLDGIYGTSNMIPFDAIAKLGEGVYTLQEKGIMTKGSAGVTMSPEEYPDLIKDPFDFLLSTAMPRKFDHIQSMSREEYAKTLRTVLLLTGAFEIYDKTTIQIIEKYYQTPVVAKACMMIPQCIILDYLRDFAGISRDIRRQPEDVLAASNAMLDVILPALIPQGKPGKDGFSNVFIPLHLPTFLRPDDYKNYYQPTFKYVTQYLLDKGYNVVYFMEADWTPYLDYLQELPDGNITCIFEVGDLVEIKKKVGNKVTVMGGMTTELLKTGTIQQNVDRAKWCLDNLAPGGNYIYGTDINLVYKDDAKIENLIAATQYVHEYGVY